MGSIGLDIGTKTIVLACCGSDGKRSLLSEINGYWVFERATQFIENMLNTPKSRSDGSVRPARWIRSPDSGKIIILGRDAEEFAFATNGTLSRPMAEGGINSEDESMLVLASIVHGMLETAENEFGEFEANTKLCFCTTADAVNKNITNIDFHERVIKSIIDGYETKNKSKLACNTIKESHAIVIDMSPDGTGIGISWGAGTTTVSYVLTGVEIFSFSWVGAGDWIDEQVAMRHGFNHDSGLKRKTARETPTTVARRKVDIDLNPQAVISDRVGIDIALCYDVLIENVVAGIIDGFLEHESQARISNGINVYMAGGTSSPNGFVSRVESVLNKLQLPFAINEIKRADKPLYCVAEGCLKAADML